MHNTIEIGLRIKSLRDEHNISQAVLGSFIHRDQSTVARIESGEGSLTARLIAELCEYFEVEEQWLLHGKEPKHGARRSTMDYLELAAMKRKDTHNLFVIMKSLLQQYRADVAEMRIDQIAELPAPYGDFVFVPQVAGEISAGGGLVPDNTVEMRIAFRREWIQRRGDPQNMSLIRVSGDSMEPTLLSGDLVLIDHGRNFVDPQGGIYAIAMDDTIMIKRLQVIYPAKTLKIISDNNRYEPLEAVTDQVRINGKVIWFGREIER